MSPIERSAGGGGGGGFTNPMTTAGDVIIENAVPAPARLGIGTAGQVLGISGGLPAWVTPPGFEFGYDQITASVTVTSATEATGTTVIACAAHTFNGSPVLATFFCSRAQPGASDQILFCLFEGATELGRLALVTGLGNTPVTGMVRFTPTAASHTYTVTATKATNNGTVTVGNGGIATDFPAFIRFTKV